MYTVKTLLYTFFYLYIFVAFFLYVAQELIIFPRIISSKLSRKLSKENRPPKGIESFFTKTTDDEDIEIWTTHKTGEPINMAGIIFHGNGETVETMNFLSFFEQVGIKAFTFDYRGTGLSTGWPSEKGLYLDAEAVYKAVTDRTGLTADKIIILGNSLGSGPSSYLASKIKPRGLILLSGYSSMLEVAKKRLFYRFFSYVTRYRLPTAEYVREVGSAFVVLAHGKRDTVITFDHLEKIRKNIPAGNKAYVFESDKCGHNDLYDTIEKDLVMKVKELAFS